MEYREINHNVIISWKGEYLEIINPHDEQSLIGKISLYGRLTQLPGDEKNIANRGRYFHIENIIGSVNNQVRKKIIKKLVEELKEKNINFIFLPTNKKEDLELFLDYFPGKLIFYHNFDPSEVDRLYTINPKKAIDELAQYDGDFKSKKEKGLVNDSDYQPPYFYVGVDINYSKQSSN